MNGDDVAAFARGAFCWSGDIRVSDGPRGGLGRIWRVDVGAARYALKEIFAEPPTEDSIRAEREFAWCAAAVGARVPAAHPDRHGRYLLTTPDGTWLRCSEWIDVRPLDPDASDTPRRLGRLLAGLHRNAARAMAEPNGGGPPDPWYDHLPDDDVWSAAFGARPPGAVATPVDPDGLVVCHRDLHPQNVFTDDAGGLVIVDCDEVGPAEPGRELARVAFDWFCDTRAADLDAVRALVTTYLADGGPGRISGPADFSMLWACRLNFLLEQARLLADRGTDPGRRERAVVEVDEMLRLMPTADQIAAVLAVSRECNEATE